MSEHTVHTHFPGRLVFIGFGSIGQGVLPLILRHVGGLTPDRITIVGVDHSKKAAHHLAEAFNVTRVPTFIIMKNGKELGRVVDYGKAGMFDKELGEILAGK